MALNKELTLQNGVTCNYHRITELNLQIRDKEDIITDEDGNESISLDMVRILKFKLAHYVSKDVRDTIINSSVKKDDFMIGLTEEDTESNLRQIAYHYIKTLPEYEDAQDC